MRTALVLALSFGVACQPDPADLQLDPHDHAEELGADEVIVDEPIATLQTGATTFHFYADGDGSAGVLEVGDGGLKASEPFAELLEEATVAQLYWALSDAGQEVPELLLAHHEAMAADTFDVGALEWGEQGWLAAEMQAVPPPVLSYCVNATFNNNICGNNSTYPDGPPCYNNLTGWANKTSGPTRRYRAGLCVQSGSANGNLSYNHYYDSACTTVCRAYHSVWGSSFNTYSNPHSNIYLNWWWIAPSTAMRRTWSHSATNHSGGVFDWGTRYKSTSNCSY